MQNLSTHFLLIGFFMLKLEVLPSLVFLYLNIPSTFWHSEDFNAQNLPDKIVDAKDKHTQALITTTSSAKFTKRKSFKSCFELSALTGQSNDKQIIGDDSKHNTQLVSTG